jgi:hypothetical protein
MYSAIGIPRLLFFIFILMVSIILHPTALFLMSTAERGAFRDGFFCHASRDELDNASRGIIEAKGK